MLLSKMIQNEKFIMQYSRICTVCYVPRTAIRQRPRPVLWKVSRSGHIECLPICTCCPLRARRIREPRARHLVLSELDSGAIGRLAHQRPLNPLEHTGAVRARGTKTNAQRATQDPRSAACCCVLGAPDSPILNEFRGVNHICSQHPRGRRPARDPSRTDQERRVKTY